MLRGAVQLRTK